MKNLIFVFLIGLSLFLSSCESCNGPSDPVPGDPNDTTVIDTTQDTIVDPDTVIIKK